MAGFGFPIKTIKNQIDNRIFWSALALGGRKNCKFKRENSIDNSRKWPQIFVTGT